MANNKSHIFNKREKARLKPLAMIDDPTLRRYCEKNLLPELGNMKLTVKTAHLIRPEEQILTFEELPKKTGEYSVFKDENEFSNMLFMPV